MVKNISRFKLLSIFIFMLFFISCSTQVFGYNIQIKVTPEESNTYNYAHFTTTVPSATSDGSGVLNTYDTKIDPMNLLKDAEGKDYNNQYESYATIFTEGTGTTYYGSDSDTKTRWKTLYSPDSSAWINREETDLPNNYPLEKSIVYSYSISNKQYTAENRIKLNDLRSILTTLPTNNTYVSKVWVIINESDRTSGINTLAKFINNTTQKDSKFTGGSIARNSVSSIANAFDNKIVWAEAILNPRKLYVRHVDENGTNIDISNPSQIINNTITTSLGSHDIDGTTYQESYNLGDNSATVNKSLTLVSNGIRYEYLGYEMCGGDTESLANSAYSYTDFTAGPESLKISITKDSPKGNAAVVVKFKYRVIPESQNITGRIDANLKFKAYASDTSGNATTNELNISPEPEINGNVIRYVPSGDYLRPYIEDAPKYLPYNIKYELLNVNGIIKYKNTSLEIYTLNSASISGISGSSKEDVFNLNNGTSTSASNLNIDTSMYSGERDSLPKFNNNIPNATIDNFTSKFLVPTEKYNGSRKPTSIVYYTLSGASEVKKATYKNDIINIFTPLNIAEPTIETDLRVDHSGEKETTTNVIQKGAEFKITPKLSSNTGYGLSIDTNKYLKKYYLVLDFDIENSNIKVNGSSSIPKGTVIPVSKGEYLKAKAVKESNTGLINQIGNTIKIVGETYNSPYSGYTISTSDAIVDSINIVRVGTLDVKSINMRINDESNYFARREVTSQTLGRIYDFKITDCNDLEYKDVFRQTDANGINVSKGIFYYSGISRWLTSSAEGYNVITSRDVGSSPKRILPLGPYKNTNTNKVLAPKLGYRISFDLKTTGNMNTENINNGTRYINITPRYYYISKDGVKENGEGYKDKINLYYKNSAGNYVPFINSNYSIYFKPNDGYRFNNNISDTPEFYGSTKLEPLEISKSTGFNITTKMMTASTTSFIQAWYGEFKLPNSTIVVEDGNINNPLKNGYVGCIFDIKSVDRINNTDKDREILYSKNDKSLSPNNNNTSQWDYEGYLGFKRAGNTLSSQDSIKIQLEKGMWFISTDTLYNEIKGTVVLFDLDNKASDDFQ